MRLKNELGHFNKEYWSIIHKQLILPYFMEYSSSLGSPIDVLVGGLVAIFGIFPSIGLLIIPIDELIFFRGVAQPPTSYELGHLHGADFPVSRHPKSQASLWCAAPARGCVETAMGWETAM